MDAERAPISLAWSQLESADQDTLVRLLGSPRFGSGALVVPFEQAFATYCGRAHAVAVSHPTLALVLTLEAYGIGAGDEVIVSPFSWYRISDAVSRVGATPVFSEIDYWRCTLDPARLGARITPRTRAILVGNVNGQPADWEAFRRLAREHQLLLIEDSTEALGSCYQGTPVGRLGDVSIFNLDYPGPMVTGGLSVVVLDEAARAKAVREARGGPARTGAVESTPLGAVPNDLALALGLVQLGRLDRILERRRQVADAYYDAMKSFEGIKDPYVAPDVTAIHWFLYVVHLGTRFSASSRNAIVNDLRGQGVEAAAYCRPAHLEPYHAARGTARGICPIAEKNGDRALALPFHGRMTVDDVAFVVETLKDASVNVGAGASIYL